MRFPRFHLSSLVFLCIFLGAAIGLWVNRGVWRLERSVELSNSGNLNDMVDEIKRDPILGKLEVSPQLGLVVFNMFDVTPDKTEKADARVDPPKIVIYRIDAETGVQDMVDSIDGTGFLLQYANGGKYLLAADPGRALLFRRTRPYGIIGWLSLSLFWVALISFLALALVALRWARRPNSNRAVQIAVPNDRS